jgi:hypothetical protein
MEFVRSLRLVAFFFALEKVRRLYLVKVFAPVQQQKTFFNQSL